MATEPITNDECCGVLPYIGSQQTFRQYLLILLTRIFQTGIPITGTFTPGVTAITPEATYPKAVAVPNNADTVVLAANASRKPGSYIQNISAVDIFYNYGAAASAATSVLHSGESLSLGTGSFVFQGDLHMFQSSGSSQNVWAVSFV